MRNSLLNMDGLGVAWYTRAAENYVKDVSGGRPPSINPISTHQRLQLPQPLQQHRNPLPIRLYSRHKWQRRHAGEQPPLRLRPPHFMYNGAISDFTAVRRDMTDLLSYDAYVNVLGSTDSEHAAAL